MEPVYLLFTGLALGLSVAIPLGPTSVTVINKGLNHGFRAGFLAGVGAVTADFVYLCASLFGFSAMVVSYRWVNFALWSVGCIVLLNLGYRGLVSSRTKPGPVIPVSEAAKQEKTERKVTSYLSGLGITFGNPTTILLWITIGGGAAQVVLDTGIVARGLFLAGVIVGILSWFGFLSGISTYSRTLLKPPVYRILELICNAVLIAFGIAFGARALVLVADLL